MHSGEGLQTSLWRGCPIRTLKAHRLHAAPLERFAGLRVLHRTDAPRHPPRTLSCLWGQADASLPDSPGQHRTHRCLWLDSFLLLALLPSALGKIEDRLSVCLLRVVQLEMYRLVAWPASPTGTSGP